MNMTKFLKNNINHRKNSSGRKRNEEETLNPRGKTIKRILLRAEKKDNDNKAPKSKR